MLQDAISKAKMQLESREILAALHGNSLNSLAALATGATGSLRAAAGASSSSTAQITWQFVLGVPSLVHWTLFALPSVAVFWLWLMTSCGARRPCIMHLFVSSSDPHSQTCSLDSDGAGVMVFCVQTLCEHVEAECRSETAKRERPAHGKTSARGASGAGSGSVTRTNYITMAVSLLPQVLARAVAGMLLPSSLPIQLFC